MTISIDTTPTLERKIKRAAAEAGLSPDEYVLESVTQRLQPARHRQSKAARLSKEESELIQKINQSLAQFDWTRYRELIRKRQAETLTNQEHLELIAMTEQTEEANVNRLEALAELARIRKTTIPALMKTFGLKPVAV